MNTHTHSTECRACWATAFQARTSAENGTPAGHCRYIGQARGFATVYGPSRVECHAPSTYSVRDLSGSNGARDRVLTHMFAFWQASGIARKGAEGWEVRDLLNNGSVWLPMSVAGGTGRADVAERSHIIAANNGGAFCPCNVLGESGAINAARGDANVSALTMGAEAVMVEWRAYWTENVARKSQLARVK
jgi:hypothetical protein